MDTDVDQNKFGGLIIITALVRGKPLGATGYEERLGWSVWSDGRKIK